MRFVLIDKILELEPSRRILASKYVAPDEDYFRDHFPGYPVVPGVLLVEMIAQAVGKCVMAELDETLWPVFLQIRRANFRKTVPPGSDLLIEAFVETCNTSIVAASGTISLAGQTVAEASVLFGFIPRSLLTQGHEDEILQAYLAGKGKNESV